MSRRTIAEFVGDFLESSPAWLHSVYGLGLIGIGILWCWGVGNTEWMPLEAAKLGFVLIGIGVMWTCIVLLRE